MNLTVAGGQVAGVDGVHRADVAIHGSIITAVGPAPDPSGPVLDARGLLVAPGFIELQVNGALGLDLTSDPAAVWDVASVLPRYGVSSFLPTVISAPLATYDQALAVLQAGPPPGWIGAVPLGWHVEGPMLNPARKGAHRGRHLRTPHPGIYGRWSRKRGVALVTMAPELPGAAAAIQRLKEAGVVVGAGHTDATTLEMQAGVAAGITYVTHLFNAMAPLAHRQPGPVGVGLADQTLVCGVIADGVHLDPMVITAIWRLLGPHRFNLVTDATAALGLAAGHYRLGSSEISIGPGASPGGRNRDGTLAGGRVGMDQAVRNLVRFTGCQPAQAIATVTSTPAALLGARSKGRIEPGADADLVVVTPALDVVATVVGGRVAYSRQPM